MLMDIISNTVLPGALALIMLGMGLSLTLADFLRFRSRMAPVLGGLGSLLLLLPIAALAIAMLFKLPPSLAVGLVLVGACPGGTFSNLLTHYSRGDLALSVTLTAIASVCVIFTMPLVVEFALAFFLGEQRDISLPALDTMRQIFLLTICPVVVGMSANHYWPALAEKCADPVKNFAGVLIVAVFLSIIYAERESFAAAFSSVAPPVIVLNFASVALGGLVGMLMTPRPAERSAIILEHTIKQEGLGIFIAISLLSTPEMVLPLMLNSLVGITVGSVIVLISRFRTKDSQTRNE
jgi:bile acid:Na+ symporter, BASS family